MLKHLPIVFAAALLALLGLGAGGASAFPVQGLPALQSAADPNIVAVRHGGGWHGRPGGYYRPGYRPGRWNNWNGNRRYWNNRYYGRRCGYYSSYCRYRYGGYWYPNQWWLPGLGVGIALSATANYGSKHKTWCANKYRSYNPKTNTYVTKKGVKKTCNSPYN